MAGASTAQTDETPCICAAETLGQKTPKGSSRSPIVEDTVKGTEAGAPATGTTC